MQTVHRSLRAVARSIHLAVPFLALALAVAACGAEAESSDELVDDLELAASPAATLVITPDPVRSWSTYVVSGCGYNTVGIDQLRLTDPNGVTAISNISIGSAGCITFSNSRTAGQLGIWKAEIWQYGSGSFAKKVTSKNFTVISGCGNGTCNPDETCSTCAADCGACPACGDGSCNGDETCATCTGDCGICPFCGDGACLGEEHCSTCPADCGPCDGDGT
jgi:hypothetical protein